MMEGVKNLVIRSQNLPVTRIVEQLMEQKSSKVRLTALDVTSTIEPLQHRTPWTTSKFLVNSILC